jgi:segregation and condensation protein A
MAATLMEIKSRLLLPKPPVEEEEDDSLDPRADLVRQLLAYRAYREAAHSLRDRSELRAAKWARPGQDMPEEKEEVDIEEAQIWDLMTAFNKLLAQTGQGPVQHEVLYDDTPITLHAADVLDRLERDGPVMRFEQIFEGRSRGEMIGLFLALLELIRQDRVRVEQPDNLGQINVHLIDATPITTVMDSAKDTGFKEGGEKEVEEDEAVEEYDANAAAARAEADMLEELMAEEDEDEISRQINAVQIGEVDLGRKVEDAPDSSESSDEEGLDA